MYFMVTLFSQLRTHSKLTLCGSFLFCWAKAFIEFVIQASIVVHQAPNIATQFPTIYLLEDFGVFY